MRIRNLFFSLISPARYLGLIKNQKGIYNRYIRERNHWDFHLNSSKQFVIDQLRNFSFKSIAIIGSGWCLDVPIDFLVNKFQKIYLIDIFHPPQIVHQLARYQNIEFIHFDITMGLIEELANHRFSRAVVNDMIDVPSPILPIDPEVVLSLNILSQLPALLIEENRLKFEDDHTSQKLSTKIQNAHIKLLKQYPSILITDVIEQQLEQKAENPIEKELIFTSLPMPDKEWIWEFDLSGNYLENKTIRLKVNAFTFNLDNNDEKKIL